MATHAPAHRNARAADPAVPTRTTFSIVSLLAATATALAPPLLAKYAVDDGIGKHDLGKLWWIVGAFVLAGLLNWAMSYVQTYLTGWVGERILADLRIGLFRHLQRLSLGFYERTRAGVIISRLTNDVEAIDQLVTDGVTSLVQNSLTLHRHGDPALHPRLAARARDARGDPADEHRDRASSASARRAPIARCASASGS